MLESVAGMSWSLFVLHNSPQDLLAQKIEVDLVYPIVIDKTSRVCLFTLSNSICISAFFILFFYRFLGFYRLGIGEKDTYKSSL